MLTTQHPYTTIKENLEQIAQTHILIYCMKTSDKWNLQLMVSSIIYSCL